MLWKNTVGHNLKEEFNLPFFVIKKYNLIQYSNKVVYGAPHATRVEY